MTVTDVTAVLRMIHHTGHIWAAAALWWSLPTDGVAVDLQSYLWKVYVIYWAVMCVCKGVDRRLGVASRRMSVDHISCL